MKRRIAVIVAVVAVGSSIAGCAQILGLGSYGNCKGGNVDVIVPCGGGGTSPGGGGPGGNGPGGGDMGGGTGGNPASTSSSATGGGGGGAPACHLTNAGMPATIISATDVPNANWHAFGMVAATASDQPVIFAAYDRTSQVLYVRGVSDLSNPDTELITFPANGNGDIDLFGGRIVGGNVVFHIRDTSQIGDLTIPIQGGHLQQNGVTFTPYDNLPVACSTPPAYFRSLAVDDGDGSDAYTCSDNGTPETVTLYLDGQSVDSVQGDDSKVSVVANHKFQNGKRMLLTFGQQGSYYRLGTNAAGLMTPSLLNLSATASSDIELVAATTLQAYGMNDFVLIGEDVPADFSSATLYSGRVAATASALAATPPVGSKKRFTSSDVTGVIVSTQADSDGSTIVYAGQDPTGVKVNLDVFDNDGNPIVTNFEVFSSPTALSAAAAAHAGLGSSYMAGWADTTQVQAISMFCSLQ